MDGWSQSTYSAAELLAAGYTVGDAITSIGWDIVTPSAQSFGYANFGGGITIRSIIEDQVDIGWTNFLCGRWSVNWKEAQKRHYLRMNKRKAARL